MESNSQGVKPDWRTHLALVVLYAGVLAGLILGLYHFEPEIFVLARQRGGSVPRDEVSRTERAIRCVKEFLVDQEQIGFTSDLSPVAHLSLYRQVQYSLAPILVADSLDETYIVAFYSSAPPQPPQNMEGYRLVQDCESGVMLFHKPGNP
jgi:hypothetical protein